LIFGFFLGGCLLAVIFGLIATDNYSKLAGALASAGPILTLAVLPDGCHPRIALAVTEIIGRPCPNRRSRNSRPLGGNWPIKQGLVAQYRSSSCGAIASRLPSMPGTGMLALAAIALLAHTAAHSLLVSSIAETGCNGSALGAARRRAGRACLRYRTDWGPSAKCR
jgi:hypothetical protein